MSGRMIMILLIGAISIGVTYWFTKDQEAKQTAQEQEMMKNIPANIKSKITAQTTTITRTVYPATAKSAIIDMARASAGRVDPFAPTLQAEEKKKIVATKTESKEYIPLPPGVDLDKEADLPPEPKVDWSESVKTSELPHPPDKPILANRVRLNAIFDNNIVLDLIDPDLRRALGMRKFITLKEGESLTVDGETTHVAQVNPDSVVLTESGSRRRLVLAPIR